MADVLRLLVQALELFALTIDRWTTVPWPMVVGAFFPLVMFALSVVVWWLRGMVWPVACEYHPTTRGGACRNLTLGEWHRCWRHNRIWQRRTDRHNVQPEVPRWERDDLYGRGFLRLRSNRIGLLYHQGFARRPREVFGVVGDHWRRLRELAWQVRQFGVAGLFRRSSATPSRLGVSEVLPQVITATRLALLLVLAGLGLVVIAVLQTGGAKIAVEYAATFLFLGAWMVVKNGIVALEPSWGWAAWAGAVYAIAGLVVVAGLSGLVALWARTSQQQDTGGSPPGVVVLVVLLLLLTAGRRPRRRRRW
jgi:hypothetical protein